MPRVKRGKRATQKRREFLKYTKGFRWGRKHKERAAKEALLHAWTHAFEGRKQKKRDYRNLWNVKINAVSRKNGLTYSKLIAGLKKKNVALDRKILANLAQHNPAVFQKIAEMAK